MFKKEELKKMAFSVMVVIMLTSGVASIGYCGGGANEDPVGFHRTGPNVEGVLTLSWITCDTDLDHAGEITTAVFVGKCGNDEINVIKDLSATIFTQPFSGEDLLNDFIGDGQGFIDFACSPSNGQGMDFLVIHKVKSFQIILNTAVAEVTMKWLVPNN